MLRRLRSRGSPSLPCCSTEPLHEGRPFRVRGTGLAADEPMFSAERARRPSSRARRNLQKEKRDVLDAVLFQDRCVARAVYAVPWESFESPSWFTVERLNVMV